LGCPEGLVPIGRARLLLGGFTKNARLSITVDRRGRLQDLAGRRPMVEEEDVDVHAGQHREEAKEAERVANLGRPFPALASW